MDRATPERALNSSRRSLLIALVLVSCAVAAIGCGSAGARRGSAIASVIAQAPRSGTVPTQARSGRPCGGTLRRVPHYRHVIWVWMENHSYGTIIGASQAPYINALAEACGVATNYHNISHPSLPNYIAATSGLAMSALQPFTADCRPVPECSTPAASIFAQLASWKVYEESIPSNCAENTTDVGCHVATIVVSPSTRPDTRSPTLFNHYSLLGSTERLLGLPLLGRAASAHSMLSAFNL